MNMNDEIRVIADAMMEKKAQDVVSLDLTKIGTAIADAFVICHAASRHTRAGFLWDAFHDWAG